MVKGVNKTIIEVNNTDSKFFERIVFYVTPEYSSLNAKRLREAAESFTSGYESTLPGIRTASFRKKYKKRRNIRLLAWSGVVLVSLGAFLIFIL